MTRLSFLILLSFASLLVLVIAFVQHVPAASSPDQINVWLVAALACGLLQAVLLVAHWRDRRVLARDSEAARALQSLLSASPFAFVSWNRSDGVLMWSEAAERMFGIRRADAVGAPLPPVLDPLRRVVDDAARAGQGLTMLQVDLPGPGGQWLQTTVSAARLASADGSDATTAVVIEDSTPRRRQEIHRLEAVRAQRDALIREVHHRIKNNLQGVAGLLRSHLAGKPQLKPLLDAATSQVLSIAAVHGLQGELQGGMLDLRALVVRIASSISGIMHSPIVIGESCAQLHGLNVVEEEAVAVAMVLNELMMNAVKHRGLAGADAMVRIDAARDAHGASLFVSNPGALPPRFEFDSATQLGTGLDLVRSLLPQRGARLRIQQVEHRVVATLELSLSNVLRQGVIPANLDAMANA